MRSATFQDSNGATGFTREKPNKFSRGVHELTAAINRAKDAGDIQTLREIAEDPHGFILRQGWANLDFSDEAELAQLRRLHETLQLEIIAVLESLNRLRGSPVYELCQLSEQKPGVLDELAAERAKLLEKESAELEKQADRLAEEIKELAGESPGRIAVYFSTLAFNTNNASVTGGSGFQQGGVGTLYWGLIPVLSIQRTGGRVMVTWPADAMGFVLESTGALPPPPALPMWSVVTNAPTVSGDRLVVTLEMQTGPVFFRLRQ